NDNLDINNNNSVSISNDNTENGIILNDSVYNFKKKVTLKTENQHLSPSSYSEHLSVMTHKTNNSISTINSWKSAKSSLSDEAEASVLIYENEIDTTKAFVDSSEMDDSSSNYSSSEVGSSSEEID